ncbi:MAG: hypothetical protein CL963_02085 [Euryarchaeota archaeon]|nr:hypothetical protein [Euryarchaeota archaeon]
MGEIMTVTNLTNLTGKDVYTRGAEYVGKVEDAMLDTEKGSISGFTISMAPESFLYKTLSQGEQGVKKSVLIPYKEILACKDIVLVTAPKQLLPKQAEEEDHDESPIPGLID